MRDDKVPVSLKLLDLRIAEVKGEITTHRLETKAEFAKIDSRFDQIDRKFDAIDQRFATIDQQFATIDQRFDAVDQKIDGKFNEAMKTFNARFDEMMNFSNAKFEAMQTAITRNQAIIEEQNARNRFALDGYTLVYEKQLETDARLARIEKHIFGA